MNGAVIQGSQELDLYWNDRPAWLTLVTPRMAEHLRNAPADELADRWGVLARDYQRAVWAVLDDVTREAVRMARLPTPRTVPNCPMPESDLFTSADAGVPA